MRFGQTPQPAPPSPYDLYFCGNPQQREKAQKLIDGIRKNISMTAEAHPPVAQVSDKALQKLVYEYRQKNICPDLNSPADPLRQKLVNLINQTKQEAAEALVYNKQKEIMETQHQQGGERVIIIAVVSVIALIMAIIGLTLYLKKSKTSYEEDEYEESSASKPKTIQITLE